MITSYIVNIYSQHVYVDGVKTAKGLRLCYRLTFEISKQSRRNFTTFLKVSWPKPTLRYIRVS